MSKKRDNTDPSTFINHKAVSHFLADNTTSISRNRVPIKYQDDLNSLFKKVDEWIESVKVSNKVVKD